MIMMMMKKVKKKKMRTMFVINRVAILDKDISVTLEVEVSHLQPL